MPKISVIVPVYNVQKYLEKCIDSLINQTLRDIEIILVDDGSTDNSGLICDKYAGKDSRIKVIHKTNEGVSCARNDGTDAATARYILFIDADDWVEPNLCEITYKAAAGNCADLVLYTYNKVYRDGRIIPAEVDLKSGFLTEEEALRFNVFYAPAVWLALYRRELCNEVRFPAGKIHEDFGIAHRYIHAAKSIFLINSPLYYYRIGRPGSIDTESRHHPDMREMLLRRADDLCSWGYEDFAWNDVLYVLVRYGSKNDNQEQVLDIVKNKQPPEYLSRKRKVLCSLLRTSPVLFDAVCIASGKRVK